MSGVLSVSAMSRVAASRAVQPSEWWFIILTTQSRYVWTVRYASVPLAVYETNLLKVELASSPFYNNKGYQLCCQWYSGCLVAKFKLDVGQHHRRSCTCILPLIRGDSHILLCIIAMTLNSWVCTPPSPRCCLRQWPSPHCAAGAVCRILCASAASVTWRP
jgi:hypothetical protein